MQGRSQHDGNREEPIYSLTNVTPQPGPTKAEHSVLLLLLFLCLFGDWVNSEIKMTAVVGSARTDDGHDHRQGTTFARADVYHPRRVKSSPGLEIIPAKTHTKQMRPCTAQHGCAAGAFEGAGFNKGGKGGVREARAKGAERRPL